NDGIDRRGVDGLGRGGRRKRQRQRKDQQEKACEPGADIHVHLHHRFTYFWPLSETGIRARPRTRSPRASESVKHASLRSRIGDFGLASHHTRSLLDGGGRLVTARQISQEESLSSGKKPNDRGGLT